MRIAYITYELPPDIPKGGIGTYTLQVAAVMKKIGAVVHIFAGSHTRNLTEESDGIIIHRIKCEGPRHFTDKLLGIFTTVHAEIDFDVIECPEIHHHAINIKKNFPSLPLVVRLHAPNYLVEYIKKTYVPLKAKLRYLLGALKRGKIDLGFWRKYDYAHDAEYQISISADVITSPSNTMKEWAVKNWKMDGSKIFIIPNPFTAPVSFLNIFINEKPQHKQIIFFGRLNVLKGLVNATYAVKKILKEYPQYSFVVIGDDGYGPDNKSSMRQWMQQQFADVLTQVIFKNGQDYKHLPLDLEKAEIALLPSLFESFSYTCAEAMAAGKAVVGSINTGMADMILNNKNGLLVDVENVLEIYKAIKLLIENNELRYNIAINARIDIITKYNADNTGKQYWSVYQSAAGNFE